MQIVFMGTPEFSVPCLQALVANGHNVVGVFTQPDKPKGRGYRMISPPVKQAAEMLGIPVYQPASLRKGEDAVTAMNTLRELAAELIVVVAYGQLLPQSILDLPKYGCVNIHASLLPRYRGAAPIQRCILEGEAETGITSMQMAAGLDTGDMLIKRAISIGADETTRELHDRLSALGAEVLVETVAALAAGTITPEPQSEENTCYAAMITKEMSLLDFSRPAQELHNIIRSILGVAFLEGRRMKLWRSVLSDKPAGDAAPGTLVDAQTLTIACGDGHCIRVTELQVEGGKRMTAQDFLRGNRLTNGQCFTDATQS